MEENGLAKERMEQPEMGTGHPVWVWPWKRREERVLRMKEWVLLLKVRTENIFRPSDLMPVDI